MRNPDRIPEILIKIYKIWLKNPDLRLGQLITNVIDVKYLYEVSDETLIDMIERLYESTKSYKGKFCYINEKTFCQERFCGDCEIYLKQLGIKYDF